MKAKEMKKGTKEKKEEKMNKTWRNGEIGGLNKKKSNLLKDGEEWKKRLLASSNKIDK